MSQGDETGWRRGLDLAADQFIQAYFSGDPWALRELGDRLDGKPVQAVSGTGGEAPSHIPIVFIEAPKRLAEEKPTLELIDGGEKS